MPLYIGNKKRQVTAGDQVFNFTSVVIDSKLKTQDEYILKDENNLFLTAIEEDENNGIRI
jgi:hypothetical protein